jgi:energy-coupling factor transporter ATP-binding protein EcfA2
VESSATDVSPKTSPAGTTFEDEVLVSEDIETLDTTGVKDALLREISTWKREAKAEDSSRYFWHVREVDEISQGQKYFVIGRKGSGKTAICEHFNGLVSHDVFAEKLSFKNFPFNELYTHKNQKYTNPNQFITIWKYLIYSTICRLMLKNESLNPDLREALSRLYDDKTSLSRRLGRWVGKEFGIELFGVSIKAERSTNPKEPGDWLDHVDFLEDLLSTHAGGDSTYYVLFDELDEDYRDIIAREQYDQYTSLITSLFKAVQDVRTTFSGIGAPKIYPVIFLRDDIYDIVKDSDKNKWGDFRVDLNWDPEKIKRLIAFRISRALDANCTQVLPFEDAWQRVFGTREIGVGRRRKTVSTFDFISRSTLLRPRDFVSYLQNCAHHANENGVRITPDVVRYVDKAFSNYLRQELTDELFAVLPDIENIFDAISQFLDTRT